MLPQSPEASGCLLGAHGRMRQSAAGHRPLHCPSVPPLSGLLGGPAGFDGKTMRMVKAQAPVHTARWSCRRPRPKGTRERMRRRRPAQCPSVPWETRPAPLRPAGDPPGAPLSRGSSPRLPFACEEFPKTTPNASPAVSKGQDQGASAPRHQHCVRGPVSPGIVTRQLTVEGTGGEVVETRQLAANEEN